jgi:hypothetical protein
VVSSDIVRALGWLRQPSLKHYFVDDVWKALGEGAGCLNYLPGVIIEHRHRSKTGHGDATYAEALAHWHADRVAYDLWRAAGMAEDVRKITALRVLGLPAARFSTPGGDWVSLPALDGANSDPG